MTLSPYAACLAAIACANLVSAQDLQQSAPTPPAKSTRRVGFLGDLTASGKVEKPAAMRFTVEAAVAKALDSNRELKAAAYLINEASGRLDGAGHYTNPELELGGGPGFYGSDSALLHVGLTQRFPVTSRLRHETRVARAELDAAREEVLIVRRRIVGEVKRDAVKLLAARDELALLRRQQALAAAAAAASHARVATGGAAPLEAGFLALDAADKEDEIGRMEAERLALLAEFRVELGLLPDADADVTGDLPAGRDAYGLPDPAACPECRKLTHLATASDAGVALEQARKWDDVGVGLFAQWEHDGAFTRHEDKVFVGVKVAIPLPLWKDNAGAVATARARRERGLGELNAEIARLDGEVFAARRAYEALSRRLPELGEKLLPAARAQVEAVTSALTKGEALPADATRALDKQVALERRVLALRRDIALALIRLETALSAHPSLKDPVVAPDVSE